MQTFNTGVAEPMAAGGSPDEMIQYVVKIKGIEMITHDVLRIHTDKPINYIFTPGQATELAINKTGWKNEKRPFTFTSLPEDKYLEFVIKTYPTHEGVTKELRKLKVNEEVIVHEVFGTIAYKGEGVFIAGGAGITPFISIFKQLHALNQLRNNKLIFANKTKGDIILEGYFTELLGKNFINILSDDVTDGYDHGRITEDFLLKHITNFRQKFYLCGPEPMIQAVEEQLTNLKVAPELIIKEQF